MIRSSITRRTNYIAWILVPLALMWILAACAPQPGTALGTPEATGLIGPSNTPAPASAPTADDDECTP
ncbi:MAG: hypothetical protein ACYC5M_09855 [Anaerolineae bacterium]